MFEVVGHDLQALVQAQAHALQQTQEVDEERQLLHDLLAPLGGQLLQNPFGQHEADGGREGHDDDSVVLEQALGDGQVAEQQEDDRECHPHHQKGELCPDGGEARLFDQPFVLVGDQRLAQPASQPVHGQFGRVLGRVALRLCGVCVTLLGARGLPARVDGRRGRCTFNGFSERLAAARALQFAQDQKAGDDQQGDGEQRDAERRQLVGGQAHECVPHFGHLRSAGPAGTAAARPAPGGRRRP